MKRTFGIVRRCSLLQLQVRGFKSCYQSKPNWLQNYSLGLGAKLIWGLRQNCDTQWFWPMKLFSLNKTIWGSWFLLNLAQLLWFSVVFEMLLLILNCAWPASLVPSVKQSVGTWPHANPLAFLFYVTISKDFALKRGWLLCSGPTPMLMMHAFTNCKDELYVLPVSLCLISAILLKMLSDWSSVLTLNCFYTPLSIICLHWIL